MLPLRQLGILAEVGLALLKEGASTLLCLVKHIVEHGGIAGKFLYTSLSVKLGIESCLNHTESKRRTFHHYLCPLNAGVLKLVEVY